MTTNNDNEEEAAFEAEWTGRAPQKVFDARSLDIPPAPSDNDDLWPEVAPTEYTLESATIWRRMDEWVLDLTGTINDCAFTYRHTEPISTPPEEVAGLPSLYRPGFKRPGVLLLAALSLCAMIAAAVAVGRYYGFETGYQQGSDDTWKVAISALAEEEREEEE